MIRTRYADGMVLRREVIGDHTWVITVGHELGRNLPPPSDRLADGAVITRVYVGRRYVRVTGLKAGRVIRRSYPLGKPVAVERWELQR